MSRKEKIEQQLKELEQLREQMNQLFYYAEEEQLLIKEDKPNGWNTLEIVYHINLVNAPYLKQIEALKSKAPKAPANSAPRSTFLGRYMLKSFRLAPEGEKKGMKWKSPASVDPIKQNEKGFKPVTNVVFRQLVQDLDQIETYLKEAQELALEKLKIKTLIPWLKINAFDALQIMVAHGQRHFKQAKSINAG